MAHRLVQEDPRPARTEHDGERPRRGLDGAELHHRLAHRLGREPLPAVFLEEEIEADAPAAAEAADLPPAVLLDDDRDVEPRERADIADRPARRPGDHDHDVLAADGGDDLAHPRIERARRRVHLVEQAHLAAEIGGDRSLRQRVEVVGLAHGPDRDHGGRPRLIGDGAGLPRRFLEIGQGQVVGVRVARALPRLGPDARALAHVPGRLLHRPLLEHQLLAHAVLEIEVSVVHAAAKRSAQQPLHRGRGQPEPIFEKALRARQHVVLLEECAKDFHPSIGSSSPRQLL